jgi:hypothetical protein
VLYVDQDDPGCRPGGPVYCRIQAAVNAAGPGTAVRVRDAATPYDEPVVFQNKSGTASHPIVLEADQGQRPVLTNTQTAWKTPPGKGSITILDSDHVVVRNLTINGFGRPSAAHGIYVEAHDRDMTGIIITSNTIRNWAGPESPMFRHGVYFYRNYPRNVTNAVARCNLFDGVHGSAIESQAVPALIEYNTIRNMQCGPYGVKGGEKGVTLAMAMGAGGFRPPTTPTWAPTPAKGLIFRYNYVDGFSQTCSHVGGLWCDVGVADGQVYGNTILNVPRGATKDAWGIHIESRCDNWQVHHNLVTFTAAGANRNDYSAAYRSRASNDTLFDSNISCGGDAAVWLLGRDLTQERVHVTVRNHTQHGANMTLRGSNPDKTPHFNGRLPANRAEYDQIYAASNPDTRREATGCPEQAPQVAAPAGPPAPGPGKQDKRP